MYLTTFALSMVVAQAHFTMVVSKNGDKWWIKLGQLSAEGHDHVIVRALDSHSKTKLVV